MGKKGIWGLGLSAEGRLVTPQGTGARGVSTPSGRQAAPPPPVRPALGRCSRCGQARRLSCGPDPPAPGPPLPRQVGHPPLRRCLGARAEASGAGTCRCWSQAGRLAPASGKVACGSGPVMRPGAVVRGVAGKWAGTGAGRGVRPDASLVPEERPRPTREPCASGQGSEGWCHCIWRRKQPVWEPFLEGQLQAEAGPPLAVPPGERVQSGGRAGGQAELWL